MRADELKTILHDDPSLIIKVMEDCGIHGIKHIKKRVQGCRPDGDNPSSVQVILDKADLNTVIHTDSNYKGGDIFSLVEYYKGIKFPESIDYICNLIGIKNSYRYVAPKKIFGVLDIMFGKSKAKQEEEVNIKLPESILDEFIISSHVALTQQGVSINTQVKFQTGYDIIDNRLLTPIRDEDGDLVTVKGRTLDKDYKSNKIAKFISYYPYNASKILYGLYENKLNILLKNEVICVESEKAVQQADSMGVYNVVAISKKKLSAQQVDKILELQCKVVLGFDKDVSPDAIIQEASNFDGYLPVEIIYDFENELGDKDSPFDRGINTWYNLYRGRIKLEDFKEWWEDERKRISTIVS